MTPAQRAEAEALEQGKPARIQEARVLAQVAALMRHCRGARPMFRDSRSSTRSESLFLNGPVGGSDAD